MDLETPDNPVATTALISFLSAMRKGRPLLYLACPYTHHNPDHRHARFVAANKAAAWLTVALRVTVFSPISMTVPMVLDGDIPNTWDFWADFDHDFLRVSWGVLILTLPGWAESRGVSAEVKIARDMGIPVATWEQLDLPNEYLKLPLLG